MSDDQLFRLIVLAGFIIFMPIGTGPYRWVRHPFYSSAVLVILGNSLAAANWFFFAAGSLVFLLLVIRTRKEEQNLIARFGDDYRNYMQRTGPFVPRL